MGLLKRAWSKIDSEIKLHIPATRNSNDRMVSHQPGQQEIQKKV